MQIVDHFLSGAKQLFSPNYNERPPNTVIDLIVIHNISLPPRIFGGNYIEQFFLNQLPIAAHPYFQQIATLKVSSHLLLYRDNSMTQFVAFNKRAWHAGKSFFQGKTNCNDFSIGIELEGCDDLPYTEEQYLKLAEIIQLLRKTYPAITLKRIVGHCDIAPERKTDPGASFDWQYLYALLNA